MQAISHEDEGADRAFTGGSDRPSANLAFADREKALIEMIASGRPLVSVLEELATTIEEMSDGLFCSICTLDEEQQTLMLGAAPSLPREFRDAMRGGVPVGPHSGSCGTAAYRRLPVLSPDIATDPLWTEARELAIENGLRGCWSTPIIDGEDLLGTFAMYFSTPREPTEHEQTLVAMATHVAAIALRRYRTEQKMQWMALHDQLTGLPNRLLFQDLLSAALEVAEREGRMLAIGFLDLDHFKRINDGLGHAVGDELLCKVARQLEQSLGDGATISRFGGDEFVIFMENVDARPIVAATIERALSQMERGFRIGDVEASITASVGISIFPDDGTSPNLLIEHADRAMYEAKACGRNGVCFFARRFDDRRRQVSSVSTGPRLGSVAASQMGRQESRLTSMRLAHTANAQEFVAQVGARLGMHLAYLRLVSSSRKSVPIGVFAESEALRVAAEGAVSDGEPIGAILPLEFDVTTPLAKARASVLLGRDPPLLPMDAWIENVGVIDEENLIGIFTVIGSQAAPLSDDERNEIQELCKLQIHAHIDGRRRAQLERQLQFTTELSSGLAARVPVVERLKRAVVAAQKALEFDSIQLITWNPTGDSVLLNVLYVHDVGFLPDTTWDSMTREEVNASVEGFRHAPGPLVIPDPADLPDVRPQQRAWMRQTGIRFLVFVPLIHEEEQYGTLVITSRFGRRETDERLAIFGSVSGHLAALLQLSLVLAEVEDSYKKLRTTHFKTIETLAIAAEMKDKTTGQHLRNLRDLSRRIGRSLGLSETELEDLGFAAVVHDVGKLQIPDAVLLKPGRLTDEEWALVKTHTNIGEEILARSELPRASREVVRWHHERWDGGGYPDGIRAGAIPLSVQIVSVADVFDALVSQRPYKQAWSLQEALDEIARGREAHFSPDVVDAFLALDFSRAAREAA